ncbi:hypothetical protein LUZ60_004321 [Juncus effusus]|nr:hypothetical protein LUZ60_004321 [Juncus effusus]
MDPNPSSQPILSYVLSRLPPSLSFKLTKPATAPEFDLENPRLDSLPAQTHEFDLSETMPGLKDPAVLAAMSKAVSDVAQTRAALRTLGPRPDHEAIDKAKARMKEIEADLSHRLEVVVLDGGQQGRAEQAEKEEEGKDWEAVEEEKLGLRAVIELDEKHEAYADLLKEAEERLNKIYRSAMEVSGAAQSGTEEKEEGETEENEVDQEVIALLEKGKILDRVDLSNRGLKNLPEAVGKLKGLLYLNLSNNQLESIPDAIGQLDSLEELRLGNNQLTALPDSIGLMTNLKILDVSGNKLKALPDSISKCSSLIELDAGYNQLSYLPTNLGLELLHLQILRVHLNKLRSLPSSLTNLSSLRVLDAHFNQLHSLPSSIGNLLSLESLNLSSNFSDLQSLPVSFGDLVNLKNLDLSNNQLHELPANFGKLERLEEVNLEQNPLEDPPMEVVGQGVEVIKEYMSQKWLNLLIEVEQKEKEMEEAKKVEPAQMSWLNRTVSSVKVAAGSVAEYLSPRAGKGTNKESYLDQQF